ncbi:MAG: hypothetical protein FWC13_07560 [Oscillospiraceae bacterium]|nr:hypothetical protein [Oscillospiraceae bacterium]
MQHNEPSARSFSEMSEKNLNDRVLEMFSCLLPQEQCFVIALLRTVVKNNQAEESEKTLAQPTDQS